MNKPENKKLSKAAIEKAKLELEKAKMEMKINDRLMAANKLEPFIKATMPSFVFEWYHYEMFEKIEKVLSGEIKKLMIFLHPRLGKEIADSTPILTKRGWITHGDLLVGDYVFGVDGLPKEVLAVIEQPEPCTLEVSFSNGEKIKCHPNHEWTVFDRSYNKWITYETKHLIKTTKFGKKMNLVSDNNKAKTKKCFKYKVPRVAPIDLPEQELPMEPYVLGAWLGDGTSKACRITHDAKDFQVIDAIKEYGYGVSTVNVHKITGCLTTAFGGTINNAGRFTRELQDSGVWENKHIPINYKYSSIEDRLQLLAGLIDTDGTVDKNGRITISTCMKHLAEDIQEVCLSLGWNAYIQVQKPTTSSSGIVGKKNIYCVGFNPSIEIPTRLPRKKTKRLIDGNRFGIESIVECKPEKGKCIQVDSPDGLYLVGRKFIPTHNSEIVSKRLPAFYLGQHPERKVICASHTATLAEGFGRKTRNIVKSPEYKSIFPKCMVADDKSTAGDWETSLEGGYFSVGVGGAVIGKGCNLGIIDDPIGSRQDAESETHRARLFDWYFDDFHSRLDPKNNAIILMHQRWHPYDLAGKLIEDEGLVENGGDWEILNYPAIDETRGEHKYLSSQRGFCSEFYESRKARLPVRTWASHYQQDPIEASGRGFSIADFRHIALSDLDPKDFTFAIHVDPAFSSRPESDDTAVIVMARHKGTGELYVLDVYGYTMIPTEAYSYILSLAEKWKNAGWTLDFISIEDVSLSRSQQLFITGFEDKMKAERKFYTLLPFRPAGMGKKIDRIKYALEPMFSRHALYFRNDEKHNTAWKKLEEQVLQFPACKRFDVIDALAQGVIMWNNREMTNFEEEKKSFKENIMEADDVFKDL